MISMRDLLKELVTKLSNIHVILDIIILLSSQLVEFNIPHLAIVRVELIGVLFECFNIFHQGFFESSLNF